jgi:hypothetical protein
MGKVKMIDMFEINVRATATLALFVHAVTETSLAIDSWLVCLVQTGFIQYIAWYR